MEQDKSNHINEFTFNGMMNKHSGFLDEKWTS